MRCPGCGQTVRKQIDVVDRVWLRGEITAFVKAMKVGETAIGIEPHLITRFASAAQNLGFGQSRKFDHKTATYSFNLTTTKRRDCVERALRVQAAKRWERETH